jgi:ABC-2 type transport system permease protein
MQGGDIRKTALRFRQWLFSSRSDLILYIIIIVLINIASSGLYLRLDLTRDNSYRLSQVSRQLVQNLERPLQINLFFSSDLPAPYNGVERYLRDLLEEYQRSAGPDFSVVHHDMEDPEQRRVAEDYGIAPSRIQEIRSDQFQSRNVYMGLAFIYGDAIRTIDQIADTAGMEYLLTTTMQRMISSVDALSAFTGRPLLTLYASSELSAFGIEGFETLEYEVQAALGALEPSLGERIDFRVEDPDSRLLEEVKERYGVQSINWGETELPDGRIVEAGSGALDLVLTYGEEARLIPISLSRHIFGSYVITGIENLSFRIEETLRSIFSDNPAVGYLTGHGEHDLSDQRNGAAALQQLLSPMYDLVEFDGSLTIPEGIRTIIINGPKGPVSGEVQWSLDQFLLRGGSLIFFLDPFELEPPPPGGYTRQPAYLPNRTGFEEQLAAYGFSLESAMVFDQESFIQQDPQYGELQIYWAPLISGKGIGKESVISRGLRELLALESGSVTFDPFLAGTGEVSGETLLYSSEKSWLIGENIELNPLNIYPPPEDELGPRPLAAAGEGFFTSAFSAPPRDLSDEGTGQGEALLSAATHLERSIAPGKIAVVASSNYTTGQLLDPTSINSNSAFVHNLVDWGAGNVEVIPMRTKGLGRNRLDTTSAEVRNAIKGFAMGVLPALIIAIGLFVWHSRRAHSRAIEKRYAGGSSNG